jgi:PAS domain S-box-containing protein
VTVSEQHWQFFDAIGAGIWVLDSQDRTEYVNRHVAEMLACEAEALAGAPFLEFVARSERERVQAFLNSGRLGGGGRQDLSLRANGGVMRWVTASTHLLGDPARTDRTLACVMVDVTDRRQVEEALRRSEARYRVLAETAEDHIFVIDRDDRVEYVNSAAARQFQTVPDKLIGRKRLEIFPPDVADRQGQSLRQVFSTGTPFYAEGRTIYLDREVWLGTWLAPVLDPAGEVTSVLGVSRDMTERKRLETELSNAQKLEAVGRLAGGIAHDFNNSLTTILGYVELLLDEHGGDAATARDLREVQQAAQGAAGLVRRLLAIGRRQVLQPTDLSVNAVVDAMGPALARVAGRAIRIDLTLAPDLRLVTGDAAEIEQVVMNLALNARDAMPDGGTLSIETANVTASAVLPPAVGPGPYVRLTIRDTGVGMDAHVKEHAFEPFFTTRPVGRGTGLGLSTVHAIVTQLRGHVWVESEPGQGSAFHVCLPVAVPQPSLEPIATEPAPAEAGRRGTILLVEDEDTVRRFAKLALERHGYQVVEASTPEDALALAADGGRAFSLLLTDVVMPRISGPELAGRLTTIRPGLPVLYMSGYPSALVLQDGQLDPATRLIAKPFTAADLLLRVAEALDA